MLETLRLPTLDNAKQSIARRNAFPFIESYRNLTWESENSGRGRESMMISMLSVFDRLSNSPRNSFRFGPSALSKSHSSKPSRIMVIGDRRLKKGYWEQEPIIGGTKRSWVQNDTR